MSEGHLLVVDEEELVGAALIGDGGRGGPCDVLKVLLGKLLEVCLVKAVIYGYKVNIDKSNKVGQLLTCQRPQDAGSSGMPRADRTQSS